MSRALFLAYGVTCHVLFLVVYAFMAVFVGDLLPVKTIDSPAGAFSGAALAVNVVLIAIFTVPHSVMARPGFKQWWTRSVPSEIERSTYVLVSCVLMVLLMWLWQPLATVVWDIDNSLGRGVVWGLFVLGWLMVPAVSLLINHFDLFGTRQVWLHWKGQPYSGLPFGTPSIYRFIRHPLYVGWMTAFWAAPTMTVGHLLFAIGMTVYMLVAIPIEERDLVSHFGEDYAGYKARVPALIPNFKSHTPVEESSK
jgi:protein-S-isoprenylcysteine O-methyltransferase Ste14